MLNRFAAAAFVLAVTALAGQANAQWKINEIHSDSTGSPDSQFVELYNPTANASVAGLTLLHIRSSQGISSTSINLSGNAVGNYYLITNANYNTNLTTAPAANATFAFNANLRSSFSQTVLVNTANLPAGFVSSPTTYSFLNADFSNGTQILDSIQFTDGTDPVLWAAQNTQVIDALGPFGFFRAPDGGTPNPYPASRLATAPNLSSVATPKASNPTSSVKGWDLY